MNRLKDLREDRDLTQAEMAAILDLHVTQYRRYENGNSDIPLELLKKIARFYDVSIDYIAGLIPIPRKIDIIATSESKKIILANTILAAVKKFNEGE